MKKTIFFHLPFVVLLIMLFSPNIAATENYSEFSVNYENIYLYCGQSLVITINSNTDISGFGIIRAELYWQKEFAKRNLVKLSEIELEMKQKSIVIHFPISSHCGSGTNEDAPFSKNADEMFTTKIYYNDVLISENDEIWVGCSTVW